MRPHNIYYYYYYYLIRTLDQAPACGGATGPWITAAGTCRRYLPAALAILPPGKCGEASPPHVTWWVKNRSAKRTLYTNAHAAHLYKDVLALLRASRGTVASALSRIACASAALVYCKYKNVWRAARR